MTRPHRGDLPLSIEIALTASAVELRVIGEIDMATAAQLRDALEGALAAEAGDLIVDLGGVTFMDSTGIAQLVAIAGAIEDDRQLVLRDAKGPVRKVIEVTGLQVVPEIIVDPDQ